MSLWDRSNLTGEKLNCSPVMKNDKVCQSIGQIWQVCGNRPTDQNSAILIKVLWSSMTTVRHLLLDGPIGVCSGEASPKNT